MSTNGLLERTDDEYPVLQASTKRSREVLRGQRAVRLVQPKEKIEKTRIEKKSWEERRRRTVRERCGVYAGKIANERGVPAYVLFSDATLRDMARLRPGTPSALLGVRGVGEKKLADLGQRFIDEIMTYCRENRLQLDV